MDFKYEMVDYHSQLFNLFTSNNISRETRTRPFRYVSPHWHRSIELIYVKSGRILVKEKGIETVLSDNQCYLINSKEIHAITFENTESKVCVLQISLKAFHFFYAKDQVPIFNTTNKLNNDPEQLKILDLIYATEKEKEAAYQVELYSLFFHLIHHLLTHYLTDVKQDFDKKDTTERVLSIIAFIEENAVYDLSASEVAQQFEISKEYLTRLLKKNTQLNFRDLLRTIRLKRAYDLLLNTDYSVTDIALECGFPNVNSFIKSFKDSYQKTPAAYRKKR